MAHYSYGRNNVSYPGNGPQYANVNSFNSNYYAYPSYATNTYRESTTTTLQNVYIGDRISESKSVRRVTRFSSSTGCNPLQGYSGAVILGGSYASNDRVVTFTSYHGCRKVESGARIEEDGSKGSMNVNGSKGNMNVNMSKGNMNVRNGKKVDNGKVSSDGRMKCRIEIDKRSEAVSLADDMIRAYRSGKLNIEMVSEAVDIEMRREQGTDIIQIVIDCAKLGLKKYNFIDPFSIFSLPRRVCNDLDNLRKVYIRLCLDVHPDKNAENAHAGEAFNYVLDAYTILQDPNRTQSTLAEMTRIDSTKSMSIGRNRQSSNTHEIEENIHGKQFSSMCNELLDNLKQELCKGPRIKCKNSRKSFNSSVHEFLNKYKDGPLGSRTDGI